MKSYSYENEYGMMDAVHTGQHYDYEMSQAFLEEREGRVYTLKKISDTG